MWCPYSHSLWFFSAFQGLKFQLFSIRDHNQIPVQSKPSVSQKPVDAEPSRNKNLRYKPTMKFNPKTEVFQSILTLGWFH
jgi:hypothetical protein